MKLPHVTDHALVRYLERARNIDVETVRLHIAKMCAAAVEAGAGSLHAEGVKFQLGTGRVITVAPGARGVSKTRRLVLVERGRT